MDEPTPRQLRSALDRFGKLMGAPSSEAEFQALFTEAPYILSNSLPLRLAPSDIQALARPGRSEPDFVIRPRATDLFSSYGVIELKRPDSRIVVTSKRRGTVQLTRGAATAVSQVQVYLEDLAQELQLGEQSIVALGSRAHMFIVMGMRSELAEKLGEDLRRRQVDGLLPPGCLLIPYDQLFENFANMVPGSIYALMPAHQSPADHSTVIAVFDSIADKIRHGSVQRPRLVILSGDRGVGKTTIVQQFAKKVGWPLRIVGPSDLLSEGAERFQNMLDHLIDGMPSADPHVLLLDDAGSLVRNRTRAPAEHAYLTSSMLSAMSRIREKVKGIAVVEVHSLEDIDPAAIRAGRADMILRLGLSSTS